MNTVYTVPSMCQRDRQNGQRGMVSVAMLCLLFILLFLGRSAVSFARQEAVNAGQYRLEMQLRLAAEGAMESTWMRLANHESQLTGLQEGGKISLEQDKVEDIETYTYAIVKDGKVYLVATAFRRVRDWEKKTEPHVRLKAEVEKVTGKDGKIHYKWLGWTA